VILRRHGIVLVVAVASLAYVAATATSAKALLIPISQIHSVAQTYEPGVYLPTAFPKSINKVDVGGATGIGNGPAPAHFLEYIAGSRSAFQLGIWRGNRAAAVVKGLLFHDGSHGSTRAFTAGRFKGTLEIQGGVSTSPVSVASYVWQGGGFTYLLAVLTSKSGTPRFVGLRPLTVIASFKV
jgi:hypothetical protein